MYVQVNMSDPSFAGAVPLAGASVSAGFPSPAEDYLERGIDFNAYLVARPAATFAVRVRGDSMKGAGIHNGDILIVDRSLNATDGSVVVAVVDGEFTVKRLRVRGDRAFLCPENPDYRPIEVTDSESQIWGVATFAIHSLTRLSN